MSLRRIGKGHRKIRNTRKKESRINRSKKKRFKDNSQSTSNTPLESRIFSNNAFLSKKKKSEHSPQNVSNNSITIYQRMNNAYTKFKNYVLRRRSY